MIQDLDKTIEKILYERGRLSRNDIDVSFEQPNGDWSARLARPTLNVWAFDLRENLKLRTMDFDVSRTQTIAARKLSPARYDLTYLVTAWARKVEDEHQLLWRALGAMVQQMKLIAKECEGAVKDQPYDLPILVGNIGERLPNTSDLWSVLNNQMKLGFTFIITVAIDPQMGFESPLVLERIARVGQSQVPASGVLDVADPDFVYKGTPEEAPPAAPSDGDGRGEKGAGKRR